MEDDFLRQAKYAIERARAARDQETTYACSNLAIACALVAQTELLAAQTELLAALIERLDALTEFDGGKALFVCTVTQ